MCSDFNIFIMIHTYRISVRSFTGMDRFTGIKFYRNGHDFFLCYFFLYFPLYVGLISYNSCFGHILDIFSPHYLPYGRGGGGGGGGGGGEGRGEECVTAKVSFVFAGNVNCSLDVN